MDKPSAILPGALDQFALRETETNRDQGELGQAEFFDLMVTQLKNQDPIDIPMYIGGKEVRTENKVRMAPPHDHQHTLGHFNMGTKQHVNDAIQAALGAQKAWAELPWEHRASIFLKQ